MGTEVYVRLSYEQYKAAEAAARSGKETVHQSVDGFYHKSLRLPLGDFVLEIHGPTVKV